LKFALTIFSILLYFLIKLESNYTDYEIISICLFVYWVLSFLMDLGKKLVFLEIVIISALFTCHIMPIVGYHFFDKENALSYLWKKYMVVPSSVYFDFMLPATTALIIGLKLPIFFQKTIHRDHIEYFKKLQVYVGRMKWEGVILIVVGVISSIFQSLIPESLGHIFFLMGYLLFIGVFYCLYSDFPLKKLVLWAAFSILLVKSLLLGMFGELMYMAIMAMILIILGKRINFLPKLGIFTVGIIVILIIQLVKPDYRKKTWYSEEGKGSEVSVFFDILGDKLNEPSQLIKNEGVWFGFYSRFNQGLYIGLVQWSVPARYPYADGETINASLAGAVVPRLLWPEKQTSGGALNFKRFLGFDLKGYSIGLSPYGEAWGNYGRTGGIIFMFFFGLLFNFVFTWVLKIAVKTPSLILWLPLMFFYAVKIESDVFNMVNSLFKACMFTFIMYKAYPLFFRGRL
jgi:hypothetical protein